MGRLYCPLCLNESFRFVCLPWFRWTRNIYSTFFGGPRKTSQPTGRSGGMSQSKTSSISALAATMRLAAISNPTFRVWDAKMIFDGCWWLGVFGPSGAGNFQSFRVVLWTKIQYFWKEGDASELKLKLVQWQYLNISLNYVNPLERSNVIALFFFPFIF